MDQQTSEFVAAWEDAIARNDLRSVAALFVEGATFRSPAVFKPYQGRRTIVGILSLVIQVFGPLTYTNVWSNDSGGVVMQFATSVLAPEGGKRLDIEGVDIFQLDGQGRITDMQVMIRPLRGLQAVAAAMELLIAQAAPAG